MSQESNAPVPESPSGEGATDPDALIDPGIEGGEGDGEPGSPPGEEVDGELELDPGAPPEDGEGDEPDVGAAGGEDDEEDEGWRNFESKFQHIKSPRDRRAAMAKWVWEKTRYASEVRKEAEEAKAELARSGAKKPDAEDETPPPTNPHIEKLDQRIKGLYAKDQAQQAAQQKQLVALSNADKEIAKIEARAEMAAEQGDDYQKGLFEVKLETAQNRREGILERYKDLTERRETLSFDMERLLQDRDWAANVYKNQAKSKETEQQNREQFNQEFPQFVDATITQTADDLKAPKDPAIRKSLWKHVNQAMMVDLYRLGEQGIDQVDVPQMVQGYVKEYLEDRDLVARTRFTRKSADKRAVTGRAPSASSPGKKGSRKPVPAALMGTGDQTPAMLKARAYLASKNL